MPSSTSTRDRILDEAMRLFGAQGYSATSIIQIEAAAGLTPGAGGIYHHFASKETLLREGVERQLSRLDALRDIRQIMTGLGDLRVQLEVTARYFLAELDSQAELVQILVSEARLRSNLFNGAMELLISGTYRSFAEWLQSEVSQALSDDQALTIASLALGSLLATRLVDKVLGLRLPVPDDALTVTWVDMVVGMIDASAKEPPEHA
jgi:AcrR family transcriptional regulator